KNIIAGTITMPPPTPNSPLAIPLTKPINAAMRYCMASLMPRLSSSYNAFLGLLYLSPNPKRSYFMGGRLAGRHGTRSEERGRKIQLRSPVANLAEGQEHIVACHTCGLVQTTPPLKEGEAAQCARCGFTLFRRKPNSAVRTGSLALAALILYFPA